MDTPITPLDNHRKFLFKFTVAVPCVSTAFLTEIEIVKELHEAFPSSGFCKKRNCMLPLDPPMSPSFRGGSFFAISSAAGVAGELCTTKRKEPDMGKRNTNSWEGQRPHCPQAYYPNPKPHKRQNQTIPKSHNTATNSCYSQGISPEFHSNSTDFALAIWRA